MTSPTERRSVSGSACFAASPRPTPTTTGALTPEPPGTFATFPGLPVAPTALNASVSRVRTAAVRPGLTTSTFLPRPGARAMTSASLTAAAGLVSASVILAVGVDVMTAP